MCSALATDFAFAAASASAFDETGNVRYQCRVKNGTYSVKRIFAYVLAAVGLLSFGILASLVAVIATGVLTPDKIRTLLKYNPYLTTTNPVQESGSIETTLLRIKATSYSLPAMGPGLVSGGGAILEVFGGILVAERSGRFSFFDILDGKPRLERTPIAIAINEEGYEDYAQSQGYDVKPGRDVGYAGLGMRLLDLLLLKDGRTLLASYTFWHSDSHCATLRVATATLNRGAEGPEATPWKQVFESRPCLSLSDNKHKPFAGHQSGGRMIELPDGKLLLTAGDFKNDGFRRDLSVADLGNDYGKVHEIDLATGKSTIFTHGHRNAQGLTQANDGRIWLTEHGPTGGDELNLLVRGTDYGWPLVTLGHDCGDCAWQLQGRHDGYQSPVFAWLPSIGVSNVIQLRDFAPLWDGDLLVASLAGEALHHLRLNGSTVIYDETIRIGDRVRDLIRLSDGRVVFWTDSGKLVFLEQDREASISERLAEGLSQPARDLIEQCRACHDFDAGRSREGKISLWQVVGRGRGSLAGAAYSPAMLAAGGSWSAENLDAFLAGPQGALPGTTMAFDSIQDAGLRKEIVDFLTNLR